MFEWRIDEPIGDRAKPVTAASVALNPAGKPPWELPREALAHGIGWLAAGVFNAVFVAVLTPSARFGERALIQGADLSQFALFGCVTAALSATSTLARRRWALPRLASTFALVLVFAVGGHYGLESDLSNLIERLRVPEWAPGEAIAGALLGLAYTAFAWSVDKTRYRLPAVVFVALAVGLTALNNLALPADYPGAHLFASLCAARAAAVFVSKLATARAASFRPLVAISAVLVLLGASSFAFGSTPRAMKPLLGVPGSAGTPFLTQVLGSQDEEQPEDAWIRAKHGDWLQDKSRAAQIPPPTGVPIPQNPVVVVLTIDALRADVILSKKHDQKLPNLARLRDESASFELARSPSPSTLTTVTSLFAGKYYSQIYWVARGKSVLPSEDRTPRFPSALSQNGVRTIHVLALRGLSANNGVGVGFDIERPTRRDYGSASEVGDLMLAELENLGDARAFAYAHFVDSHAPYNSGGVRGSNFERYLGEVALVDQQIGRLRTFLTERGLAERTILIVSADHGEAFGEHGSNYHAKNVYDELLRVPLLVHVPKLAPRSVKTPVTLLDLGPTILHMFRLGAPADMFGESLIPALLGRPFAPERPIAADAGRRIQALIYPDGVKAIRDLVHKTHEVYDLKVDPGELRDLSASPAFAAGRYKAGLSAFFQTHTLKREGWEPPWRKF